MGIIEIVKGWFSKMIKITDIEQVIGQRVALSSEMAEHINKWLLMYGGKAEWVDNKNTWSLRLEKAICKEFADVSLTELEAEVTNEKIDEIFRQCLLDMNESLQMGLALGSFIIKPLTESTVEFVTADSFIPVQFDSRGRLIKVVFVETRKISIDLWYRRFEYHSLDGNVLTITNKAYKSTDRVNIGTQVSLGVLPDWEGLAESVSYPNTTKPVFGYYRNPIPNTVDGSACGQSIFNDAAEMIRNADTQFSRLEWEYSSGERAIYVSQEAIRTKAINGEVNQFVDSKSKRMYKKLSIDSNEAFFEDYSPTIRDSNFSDGLENYLRKIELTVGLSYGDISNPQNVERTATEVKIARKRKYNTVNQIESNLKDCLIDLAYAIAFWNGLTTSGYDVIVNFNDSILNDEETERNRDLQEVAAGLMSAVEYRVKWRGETEEEAMKNVPEQSGVIV